MSSTDEQISSLIRRIEVMSMSGPTIERALHRIGMLVELKVKENIREKGMVNTGNLINSIKYSVNMYGDGSGGEALIGTYGVKYAGVQEFGGTILPRNKPPTNAKRLSIPLSRKAKQESAAGRGPGLYGRSQWDPRLIRRGNILYDKATGSEEWVLVEQVKIKEKRFMRDGFDSAMPRIIEILRKLGGVA